MRDPKIAIKILDIVRKFQDFDKEKEIHIEGIDDKLVSFHVMLLHEGGYLKAKCMSGINKEDSYYYPVRLTWKGYEFIDQVLLAKQWGYWDSAAKLISGVTGVGTLETCYEVLKKIITKEIK